MPSSSKAGIRRSGFVSGYEQTASIEAAALGIASSTGPEGASGSSSIGGEDVSAGVAANVRIGGKVASNLQMRRR